MVIKMVLEFAFMLLHMQRVVIGTGESAGAEGAFERLLTRVFPIMTH